MSLIAALGAGFVVLLNYSEIEHDLTCDGRWQRGAERQSEVAYVTLTEYRWWVRLWSESDGNVQVQTDKLALMHYVPFVQKIGKGSQAMFAFKESRLGKMDGGYRAANNEITVRFLDDLIFVGTCRKR